MSIRDRGAERRTQLATARLYLVCGALADRPSAGGLELGQADRK